MNNIIKSQMFLCKKYWLSIMAAVVLPIVFFVFLFSTVGVYEEPKEMFSLYGTIAMIIVLLIVSYRIIFDYIQRIQMYEIMAGKKPHQIILGRMLVFLPITLAFLAILTPVLFEMAIWKGTAVVSLRSDLHQNDISDYFLKSFIERSNIYGAVFFFYFNGCLSILRHTGSLFSFVFFLDGF